MQVTRSLQNNMSIKWARPAEESICCSLKLFLHMHNLELQFLEKKNTTSTFGSATSKLKPALPHVLMKLLMYQTKIHVRRLHRAHYHPSWSQQMRSDKTEKFTEKAFLSRKTCFKASSDTLSASLLFLQPPQHICMKKVKLYKENVTTEEASLSIRPLKHFIGPSVRARAAWCYSLTCVTSTHPPWSRSRTQVMLGRARGTQQRCW